MAGCRTDGLVKEKMDIIDSIRFDSIQFNSERISLAERTDGLVARKNINSIQFNSGWFSRGDISVGTLASLTSHFGHRQKHGRFIVGMQQQIIDVIRDTPLR
jgi:hypothetical protein